MPDSGERLAAAFTARDRCIIAGNFAGAVDALLMTIDCARRIAAKPLRNSADPLTKPKREPRKIAPIAKAR
jgi:hypothetical protein